MNSIKTYVNSLGRATRTVFLGLAVVFVSAGIAQAATTISTNILTDGTLGVTGASTLTGAVTANGALNVVGISTFGATASTTISTSGALSSDITRATGVTGSFQNLAGDLTYQGNAGGTSAFHSAVMGHFHGSTLTNTQAEAYHAGVIGAYSVATSDGVTGPKAGVVGAIGVDGLASTAADAAVMAVLDGGDPGATITANAAYGVQYLNAIAASKFTYGLDLSHAAVGAYPAVSFGTADIRLSSGAVIKTGAASPNGSVTAPKGSLYVETDTPALWQNTDAGTTWSTGAASAKPYAMFYGTTSGTGNEGGGGDYAATVAAGAPVPFPRNGATSDSSITRGIDPYGTSFILPNTGTYEVTFNVGTTEAGQLQLAFRSGDTYTPIARTTAVGIGSTTGSPIGGTYFITATAGQYLAVINPAGNPAALTITPAGTLTHANSPSLTIKQL